MQCNTISKSQYLYNFGYPDYMDENNLVLFLPKWCVQNTFPMMYCTAYFNQNFHNPPLFPSISAILEHSTEKSFSQIWWGQNIEVAVGFRLFSYSIHRAWEGCLNLYSKISVLYFFYWNWQLLTITIIYIQYLTTIYLFKTAKFEQIEAAIVPLSVISRDHFHQDRKSIHTCLS